MKLAALGIRQRHNLAIYHGRRGLSDYFSDSFTLTAGGDARYKHLSVRVGLGAVLACLESLVDGLWSQASGHSSRRLIQMDILRNARR